MKTIKILYGDEPYEIKIDNDKIHSVANLLQYVTDDIFNKYHLVNDSDKLMYKDIVNDFLGSFVLIADGRMLYFASIDTLLLDLFDYLDNTYKSIGLCLFPAIGGYYGSFHGVKFFTHSNEENHRYSPHIHTEWKRKKSSYYLMTGDKRDGKPYPPNVEKSIRNKILDNRDNLLQFWRDTTNGLIPMDCDCPFPIQIEKFKNLHK